VIELTQRIAVPDEAISVQFIRGSGPGGQNVNKVATAVQLRLHLDRAGLPQDVRARLERLAGRRLTQDGDILIEAQRFRTQERNREDALERLAALVASAEKPPKPRVPTRTPRSVKQRRTDVKTRHGQRKRLRGRPGSDD
jgi:ribosome-associated protein